jgi:hypothetical protein
MTRLGSVEILVKVGLVIDVAALAVGLLGIRVILSGLVVRGLAPRRARNLGRVARQAEPLAENHEVIHDVCTGRDRGRCWKRSFRSACKTKLQEVMVAEVGGPPHSRVSWRKPSTDRPPYLGVGTTGGSAHPRAKVSWPGRTVSIPISHGIAKFVR